MFLFRIIFSGLFLLVYSLGVLQAQITGIYCFHEQIPAHHPNVILTKAKQLDDDHICFLGNAKTVSFRDMMPCFLITDTEGHFKSFDLIESGAFLTIDNFATTPGGGYMIYGSEQRQGNFRPVWMTISPLGGIERTNVLTFPTATFFGDVLPLDSDRAMACHATRIDSTGVFNIAVYKTHIDQYKPEWYKILPSSHFEQAGPLVSGQDGFLYLMGKWYNESRTRIHPLLYKLDREGKLIWKKVFKNFEVWNRSSLATDKEGHVFFAVGSSVDKMASNTTWLYKFSADGEEIDREPFYDIDCNEMILLDNDQLWMVGSNLLRKGDWIITKAALVRVDKNLKRIGGLELTEARKPDADIPGYILAKQPTASEYNGVIKLKDGSLACYGRAFIPDTADSGEMVSAERRNRPLVVILNKDGMLE